MHAKTKPAQLEAQAERELAIADPWHRANLEALWSSSDDAPECVIERILPAGHVTLLGSHGGGGKSILAETIGAHVAANAAFAGLETIGGRAVFVSLEDPATLVLYRLRRILREYHRLHHAAVFENLLVLDGSESDPSLVTEVPEFGVRQLTRTAAFEALEPHLNGARLVVVDNASDAYDADANDRRLVKKFIRMLAQIARKQNAAVLLLAHVDKSAARYGAAGNSFLGSVAWHNSTRSRLALNDVDGFVQLSQEKNNLGRRCAPIRFRWTDAGVLVPTGESSPQILDTAAGDDAAVILAMRAAAVSGQSVPTSRLGSCTTQKLLETVGLPPELHGTGGRQRFWAAVDRLIESGCAECETYTTPQRKKRDRLVLVSDAPNGARATPPITPVHSAHADGAPMRTTAPNAFGAYSAHSTEQDDR